MRAVVTRTLTATARMGSQKRGKRDLWNGPLTAPLVRSGGPHGDSSVRKQAFSLVIGRRRGKAGTCAPHEFFPVICHLILPLVKPNPGFLQNKCVYRNTTCGHRAHIHIFMFLGTILVRYMLSVHLCCCFHRFAPLVVQVSYKTHCAAWGGTRTVL